LILIQLWIQKKKKKKRKRKRKRKWPEEKRHLQRDKT
jgi:hypothetical protein